MHRRLVAAALCLTCAVPPAAAGPTPDEEREADQLFDKGRGLLDAGRAAEACPHFEKSQALDPGRGTLINLAACYEAVGRLVAALAVYRDVAAQSEAAGDQPRLDASRKRIAAIEARIPHLAIDAGDAPRPDGFAITVAGAAVAAEAWGDILVDPGTVAIRATAPGHQPFETTVETATGAAPVTVPIPALEPARAGDLDTVVVEKATRKHRLRSLGGIAVAGAGAVLLGGSIVLAFGAKGDYDDALGTYCGGQADGCDQTGLDLTRDARRRGNLATIVGGVGLAAIAGGVILWLTAPTEEIEVRRGARLVPQLSPDGAGLAVAGWF